MKFAVVFLFALVIVACSESTIPDQRLVDTYADVLMVREQYGDSVKAKQKVDSVLASHQYPDEEFQEDLRSMGSSPDLMKAFYDSVTYKLRRRRDSLR